MTQDEAINSVKNILSRNGASVAVERVNGEYRVRYMTRVNILDVELGSRVSRSLYKKEDVESIISRCECIYPHFIDYLYAIIGAAKARATESMI